MRTVLAATALTLIAHAAAAQAVATPPAVPGVKPKPVATTTIRPNGAPTPAPADAAAIAERTAIQSDLAWVGGYNGAINGEAGERYVSAIKTFQKNNGGKQTGVLTAQERALLAGAAKKPQGEVGWTIVTDMATGARIGLPGKLLTQQTSDATGTRWASPTGTTQVSLARRKDAALTTAKLAEQERKEPAGRRIDYSTVKPDVFVVAGMQGLKKFYVRGQVKDAEVRILTILYDQAVEGTMEPVTIAMSSAFVAFPTPAQAAAPPPRKLVEYATGIVVNGDGAIVTDRLATDGCLSLVVAGHGNAERIAEDKAQGLALLRVYGARDLKPLGLGGAAKPALDVIGIADPQSQGGGRQASVMKTMAGAAGELTPAPGLGFSGAPVRDGDGAFAGIALLKPVFVAGPAPAVPAAGLVPADAVRAFLRARKIAFSEAAGGDASASVVRVICVRK